MPDLQQAREKPHEPALSEPGQVRLNGPQRGSEAANAGPSGSQGTSAFSKGGFQASRLMS